MFIYLGKANSYNDLKSNLKTRYNLDLPVYNANYIDAKDIDADNGGSYWYIEGNATTNMVKIRNFSWKGTIKGAKNLTYVRVWKITQPKGHYKIGVFKLSTNNDKIGGAKFTIEQKISGNWKKPTGLGNSSNEITCNGGTNGNFGQLYDTDVNEGNSWDTYRIKETAAPSGYKISYTGYVYLSLYKESWGNKYQVTKIRLGTSENQCNEYDLKTKSETYEVNDSVSVQAHKGDDGEIDNVINFVVKDEKEENFIGNTYNATITKIDADTGASLDANFRIKSNKINIINPNFSTGSMFYTYDQIKNAQIKYSNNEETYVDSGKKISNTDITIGSNDGAGVSRIYANALSDIGEHVSAGNKYSFVCDDKNGLSIKDTFDIEEWHSPDGYIKDEKVYSVDVIKSYNTVNYNGKFGHISEIHISHNGKTAKLMNPTNGTKLSLDNLDIYVNEKNGGFNFDIKFKNKKITGSYNLYIGKKSSYNDYMTDASNNFKEITCSDNLAGAKFKVEMYLNGASYPDTRYIESVDKLWNDGKEISVNITNTTTDRFYIEEVTPPTGYNYNKVKKIWIDVHKKESDNKYVIDYIDYTFRDEKDEVLYQKRTNDWGASHTSPRSGYNTGFMKLDNDKLFCIFMNDKQYSLNISKRDKNNNIISSPESSNASFSIKMFKTFSNTNGHISLSDNREIYSNSDIDMNNIKTVDGQISLNNLSLDREWLHKDVKHSYNGESYDAWDFEAKTLYYLITENTPPNGYNSIGSLILGIHFDENGNSTLDGLYHVEAKNGGYDIIKSTEGLSSNLTVNVGNDGISANANSTNNIINIDIQQPDHEDSYYDLQLEKKDASDNNQLAGVKFKVSNVKINNSDIKSNNNENAFSITSKETVSNVINEIYTNANDDSKNKIGEDTKVLNSNDTTDTYTIEETESITGYELNTIKTNLKFYKKNENSNIKNDHASVVFDTKNADGNYVSGNELQITDGYFVSSLDSTASTNDDRKVENLDNYIDSLKNENIVIVYYAKGKISVQYYNKLEGTYSVVLNKYVNNRVSNDSSINFNISLYKNKNSNNEFSETDEIKEVQTKKGTVKLSDLTTAQSITDSLQEIFITENEIGKTYYYVLEETKTRNDLIKLDYKIVIPFKFVKDEYNEYVVTNAEEKGFGLKNNEKIEIRNGGLIHDNENACYIIGESGLSLMQIMVNNFEKEGNYNLKLLKIKAKDGFTADLLSQLKNANSINDLNALAKSGARFIVRRTTRGGSSVSENARDITSEEGKVKDVYDGKIDINEDDMNFNSEYNEENGGDAKLDYGTSRFTIDEWSAGSGMKVNKAISNLEIETKLSRDTDKYSLTDVKVYDKTQNKEITADEAFTKYGLFVKIMNSEDGTPILITAVADDVITGEFSFNLKKVNSKTGKELTAEECNGMKFNFGLYQGGDSYDNPGTKVTELTKKDGTTVNISNLTTLQEINDAMSNIEITEEMDKQTTYRLIIEETEAPADFVKFNHKIGCTLISNQDENEEYKMIYTDFKVYDGKYWQYYSQYEEVDFNQTDSINTLTLTLKNVPKTGSYNLDVEKVDLSGNDIKDETTRFSVKAYSSLYNRTDGKFALEASSRIEIKDKEENILTATDGKSTELRDIQINKEDIGKTYYFVIEETDAPYQFTKLNYKIVVPITFSENENEYKASKCEAYAFVKDESISDSSYEDKAVYIKKSLSEVATSQNDTVKVEQNQDSTTINVKVPNKSEYTLKIKKVSAGTNTALSNVQFNLIGAKINGTALKNSNNQEITTSNSETVTTDSEGLANVCENTSVPNPVSITSVEGDEYYFTEKTIPDGYRKLPDDKAIKLDVIKDAITGKVSNLAISIVNTNDKKTVKHGENTIIYQINDYGDTVKISAVKTSDSIITLTVADPEDTRNGNYNLYLVKKDNKNERLEGVNFELIGATVNNEAISQNNTTISEQNPKAIVTEKDRVSVYTNAKDNDGNDVIQINNANSDDVFILREKDLGSNKGYTQLPSNYKIKVTVKKTEENNNYFVSGTTLELYNGDQKVSPKANTEDEYEINGVTYKISLEKSGSNITVIVENPKVEGEYKLNVIKKDVNNEGSVSGFDSFGTNSVAGAKFNVTVYKGTAINNYNFNFDSSTNRVKFDEYTTKGTTEDLSHDKFKRTGVTYFDVKNKMIDIWNIEETDPPTGFEAMKKSLVLGIEKSYNETTKQFYIDTIHIYQKDNSSIKWDPQSYEEINKADGSVMYTYVSSDNDTWQIMLNKDRTQIAVSADNIPNGEYKLNVMKKITDDNSSGDTADSAKSGASFNIQLYKDIDLNSSDFKFGSDNNPNNFENFTQGENEYISYETKGNAEDLTNDKFKRTGITTDSVGNKYDIWKINEWSAPDGLDTYSGQLVLGVKKKYNSDSHTFSIESITMYKVDGNGIKSSNNVWEAQTVHDVNNSNADSTEMNTYTTYSYFDTDSTGNNVRRWDFVIKNNSQIYVTLHNNPTEYGSYNVNLVKHDEYGNNISGVKFMAVREINGGAPEAIYTEQNPLVTSYTNVNIGGTVNIDGTKVNTDDVYTLKELDLDENSEYTKIPGNIKLTVKKATRKNSNYSKTHYVERIQLRLVSDDGQKVITPTEDLFNKQVIETTINGEKANITAELIDNTITITVVNPDKTGLYSLDLTKVEKGTNTPLDGAEFEVKYYNSMSTQNETESVNVLNSDGTISTVKTSEIKTVEDFKKLQNIIVTDKTFTFSYWTIKETKAPAGHDLLKYKIEIRMFKENTSDGYKVSSDRARALYEDGTNKLLEDLTEDEPKTTITEDKKSSTYKLNINVENAITPKGTYSLNLNKVDKATKSNLTGAEFEVSLKSGRTKIPSVTIVNDDNTETTIDLSTIKSVDDFNKLKNIKITSEGSFVWQIKETKAPEGFKKLDYYISIIFNSTNVNNNYVIKKVSADAIYESDGSYRSTPIEALDKNEPQTTITETTTGTYQANITIENNSYGGSYKLSLMKKNEADASHDIYSNGDDSRSALAGATFDVKLYKNIQKNNSNFEFNSQYNEENKGPYTTVGADDLSESNEIVRDGLTSSGFDSNYYDIWKIEETTAPGGYIKMTDPLVLGVEKNYDSTTNTFTINDIYVYQKNSNGLKSDGGKWVVLPVTNKEGNTAHGKDGNAMVKNSTYIFEQDGNKWSLVLSADKTRMIVTAFDKKISKFNFKLIKKEQGAEKTLPGALFEITIKDENGNPLKTASGTEINKYQQTTSAAVGGDSNGTIKINDILIDGENKKYTVEITELLAPAGYEKIMDTISFQVTSKLADDGSYMLIPGDYTVENTKQCEVDESGNVIVTVEDKKTEKVEFAIYKKWENVNDTELPDSITVELYQVPENKLDDWNKVKGDANARQEYLYRGAYGTGGQVTLTKADALNGNNLLWYHKWTGLSKENTDTKVKNIYYVIETDGPEGFITTYEPNNYKSPDVNTVTITNTKETTQYTIQKVWDKNVQTSSMPRTLQVSLFAFNKNDENDTKLYNELIGYVNNKQYNEINNKIAELTDKKVGSSIGLSVGNQWSFTWSELSKDNNYFAWETDANALSKFNITNAVISDEGTKMTITNTQPEGSFKLKLIKKLTNTNITLANAKFTLSIKDEAGNELIPNTSYEYKTDANGEIVVDKLAITGPNKEYTVTIKETKAPAGYAKLTDEVSFKVKSHAKADGSGFELIANDLTPIKNAKDAKVTEDGIEVTIYNDLTSPHKGVKDIKNQDSGYYDNVTGKVYTSKEEVASTLHDWVIQTTIPEGITAYTTYEISDEINEKLVFAGLDTVKVKYVNGADLTKDKDYKVTYDEASRMLKVTFIDESFKGGYNLEVGKDVEIRFNTTFALDNDGNIIAINEEVPNQAKLTYGNDSNNKQTKLTEIPEVHTGGVGIYKYDKKTNKALEGAHFKIATSKENALAGIFVKDGNGQDIEKITNSNGLAEFAGLEFGEDALNKAEYETYDSITGAKVYKYDTSKLSTTYYLVETESPKGYLKLEEPVEVVVKVGSYDMKDITSLVQVGNEEGIYDLSLRKFITAVKDTAKGTEEEVTSRIPQVDLTKLASGESTTATYTHPKDPVLVHTTDIVTYTIRIYNEGPQDAYASIVKDDIPDGLQFVQYTEGDGSLNAEYRWKLVDENDNEVTDVSKAKYIVTDYLSKEQDKTPGANLLKAYKPGTMSELDYRDVKVQFKVTEPTTSDRILINYAQISKETDSSGRVVRDRDSTPNVWVEGEDDQDIEKVRVQYFDLSLRKWVTQAIVTENGKTVVTQTGHKAEDNPEEVVKVDLKKSKINNVVVKFRYSIRITNEGEIAGEATEIRDDIPQGLKFVAEDNPDWREENGQIVTNKLEHTTLQPGESAEVEILLTWINSANNMGVMTNVAEINKDHNDYGAPDIDSTPGNNVPGEDDIDDAPVMLTVKTGSEYILYASIALSAIAVIAVGGKVIKKKVMRNI